MEPIKSQNSMMDQEDPSYQVMPHANKPTHQPAGSAVEAIHSQVPAIAKSKLPYIISGIVALVVLTGLAFFLLGNKNENSEQKETSRLPKTWLTKYFNTEICADQSVCGDDADPDNDGLNNYDEFKLSRTDLTKSDTDEDGLADGDEHSIYKTDPTDKFTDKRTITAENNYTDGHQVKSEYDPLTPGFKLTETRKQQIAEDTAKFGLHEPTKTTLTQQSTANTPQQKIWSVFIEGEKFNPESLDISANDSVVWLNKDSTPAMIASNPHPTHTALSALVSGALAQNQTYSFKFEKTGVYGYHNHLNPGVKGSVTVK